MPSNEEDSDSHTGGNHHQRGITCSGKLVGSPCCPPVSGSAPFSESMLEEGSRRQLHRPAYEVGAGFPLRISRGNHHFRELRRHSDQGLVRHGSSPIWTRSDLLTKDSSSNSRHTLQCPRWWSRTSSRACTTADWIRNITMSLPTAALLACSTSALRAPPQARSSGCQ